MKSWLKGGLIGGVILVTLTKGYMDRDNLPKQHYFSANLMQIATSETAGTSTSEVTASEGTAGENILVLTPNPEIAGLESKITDANKRIDGVDKDITDLKSFKTDYAPKVDKLRTDYDAKVLELETAIKKAGEELTKYKEENNLVHIGLKQGYEAGDDGLKKQIEKSVEDINKTITDLTKSFEEYKIKTNDDFVKANGRIDLTNKNLEDYQKKTDPKIQQLRDDVNDLDGYISIVDEQQKKTRKDLEHEKKENLKNPIHLAGRGLGFVLIDVPLGIVKETEKGLDKIGKAIFKPKHEEKEKKH